MSIEGILEKTTFGKPRATQDIIAQISYVVGGGFFLDIV
jgi:hypothetical protein